MSWKKIKKMLGKAKPDKRAAHVEERTKLYEGIRKGEIILVYVDEARFHRDMDLGYTWGRIGKRIWRKSGCVELSERLNCYVGYDFSNGECFLWEDGRCDGERTVKFLRLSEAGEVALVEKAIGLIREYSDGHKKPAISERHGFRQFNELAKRKAQAHDATLDKEPEVIAKGVGVEIFVNPQADRVQIVFAAKPSVEIIGKLRTEAWNWSRTEGAWQRKITEAAKSSAKRITGLG